MTNHQRTKCCRVAALLLCGLAIVDCATAAGSSAAPKVADWAACSCLIGCKQPTEKALQAVAGLGYRWVDLSCMSWASHVSVPKLLEDFDKEAARVEAALAASGLKVANLTFDSCYDRPFEQYEKEFQAVVKVAVRLKAGLICYVAEYIEGFNSVDPVEESRKFLEWLKQVK